MGRRPGNPFVRGKRITHLRCSRHKNVVCILSKSKIGCMQSTGVPETAECCRLTTEERAQSGEFSVADGRAAILHERRPFAGSRSGFTVEVSQNSEFSGRINSADRSLYVKQCQTIQSWLMVPDPNRQHRKRTKCSTYICVSLFQRW